MMPYHHTQPGIVIMAVCLVIGAVGAAILWRTGQAAMVPMLVILAAVCVVFHSLNVEIEGRELRWYFGPGFWTYRLVSRFRSSYHFAAPRLRTSESKGH